MTEPYWLNEKEIIAIHVRYPDKPNRTDQAYTTASDEKRENKSLP